MLEELCFSPFFLQSDAKIITDNIRSKGKKLHNSAEKLHNSGTLTDAEKRKIASTSLQDIVIKQGLEAYKHEAEQRDLQRRNVEALEGWLQLQQQRQPVEPNNPHSFTKDELDQYVAHRKEGLLLNSLSVSIIKLRYNNTDYFWR